MVYPLIYFCFGFHFSFLFLRKILSKVFNGVKEAFFNVEKEYLKMHSAFTSVEINFTNIKLKNPPSLNPLIFHLLLQNQVIFLTNHLFAFHSFDHGCDCYHDYLKTYHQFNTTFYENSSKFIPFFLVLKSISDWLFFVS